MQAIDPGSAAVQGMEDYLMQRAQAKRQQLEDELRIKHEARLSQAELDRQEEHKQKMTEAKYEFQEKLRTKQQEDAEKAQAADDKKFNQRFDNTVLGDVYDAELIAGIRKRGGDPRAIDPKQGLSDFSKTLPEGVAKQAIGQQMGGPVRMLGTPSQQIVERMSSKKPGSPEWLQDAMRLDTQPGAKPNNLAGVLKLAEGPQGEKTGRLILLDPIKGTATDKATGRPVTDSRPGDKIERLHDEPRPPAEHFMPVTPTNPQGVPQPMMGYDTRTNTMTPPKMAGGGPAPTLKPPPGASQLAVAADKKQDALRTLSDVEKAVDAAADFIGPGKGQVTSFNQMLGIADPKAQELAGLIIGGKMKVDAGIGGQRAAASPQLLAQWDNLLGMKVTPEGIKAAVRAMRRIIGDATLPPIGSETKPTKKLTPQEAWEQYGK